MQKYKQLIITCLTVNILIGTMGVHLLNHQCIRLENHQIFFSVYSFIDKNSCEICHPENQKSICCNISNIHDHLDKNCCKTDDLYFKINSEFFVSLSLQELQPNVFVLQGFPESIGEVSKLLSKITIVNENPPPISLWGHRMIQVLCTFKIGDC